MPKVAPRLIALDVEGVDRSDEISKIEIVSAAGDPDFLTFKAARDKQRREHRINLTIAQDHASGTLWDFIWEGVGTKVEGVYAPYGNADPSAAQPHYSFTAEVTEPDGALMGGEANRSTTAVTTVEVSWLLDERPTKVTV